MTCQLCGHGQRGIKYLATSSPRTVLWKNYSNSDIKNTHAIYTVISVNTCNSKLFSTTSLNHKPETQTTNTTNVTNSNNSDTSGKSQGNRAQDVRLRTIRDRMIRVDHAGEYGANRIYAGQMAVLGKTKSGPLIQHMWDQEKVHLDIFEKLMPKYRARPTILLPFWNVAGFVLGAGTALLGERAAMACTVAVESSITEHYNNQIRELMTATDNPQDNKELMDVIQKCRDEEQEHHDTGLEHEAEKAPGYSILTQVIKRGCKTAIWLSEKI